MMMLLRLPPECRRSGMLRRVIACVERKRDTSWLLEVHAPRPVEWNGAHGTVPSYVVLHDLDQQSAPDKRINFFGCAVRLQRYRCREFAVEWYWAPA